MKRLHEIKSRLCEELDSYAGRSLSRAELDEIHKLTDTIKNIYKIEGLEDGSYSMDGGWEARGMYSRDGHAYARNGMNGNSYDDGNSYGNYSNNNRGMHYVRGHYSRADGRKHIVEDIDMLLEDESLTATQRSALMRAKQLMEQ